MTAILENVVVRFLENTMDCESVDKESLIHQDQCVREKIKWQQMALGWPLQDSKWLQKMSKIVNAVSHTLTVQQICRNSNQIPRIYK